MITSIKHKGLSRFAKTQDTRGLPSEYIDKIYNILTFLNELVRLDDLTLPKFGLHRLKGNLKDYYAVKVSANWRIIFQFDGKNVDNVDLIDYH